MSPPPDELADSGLGPAPPRRFDAARALAELRRAARDALRPWLAGAVHALSRVRLEQALHAASVLLVSAIAFSYLHTWFEAYREALLDPRWQTDDARTALFAFHRFAPGAPLASDPIAREMLEYQPYAFQWLYRALVPWVGLLAAAKIVQGGLIALFAVGGVVLARSRRAGLGVAALFVFLFLRDQFVMDRVGGALPRGFGFPTMALWLAGALAERPWVRRAGALSAALTYPSALAMILAAEGLLTLRGLGRPGWRTSLRRTGHFAALVVACAFLLLPTVLAGSDGGPIHTLEQAQQDPAFGPSGRLKILPLAAPGGAFGGAFLSVFQPYGSSPWPRLLQAAEQHSNEISLLVLVGVLLLVAARVTPLPRAALAFLIGCLGLYAIASLYAFRLYSPERYYSYGARVAGIGLALGIAFVAARRRPLVRHSLRNLLAAAVIGAVWLGLGDGLRTRKPLGMSVSYGANEALWNFLKTLPLEARIASHPRDGDDIPLFGQRANNGAFETMQPWLTRSWARQKARAEDTLRAFYADDPATLLAYCHKYAVSHLLVNDARYRRDFVSKAAVFEPLTSFARDLVAERKLGDLVLHRPPRDSVVFEQGRFQLVDVKLLERAWSASARSP